jgi:folate-binding protein YgfZ
VTSPAIVRGGPDAGLPWHYGDPFGEQRTLAGGAGLAVRDNRDVLTVTGPDRLSWLHAITSQHLAELTDGDSRQGLVLSPHGHVEQHWWLTELKQTCWLDTEPAQGPALLGYLHKMIFMKQVVPSAVPWAVLTLAGPAAPDVLATAGLPVPDPLRAAWTKTGVIRRRDADTVDLLTPRQWLEGTVTSLLAAGARPVGTWAYEARRVERREPRLGFETDHRTIPHEVGWIGSAVHLNKGCYRGQETVARVQNLGRPPRRLVLAYLSGQTDELPATGAPVRWNDRAIGFLGTAVQHYELGPIALAVIKRSLPEDAELTVDGAEIRVDDDQAG